MASARGTATRKRSFACGEPVQFQLSGFLACNRAESPMWQGHGRSYKLRDDGIVPLICPTCQNVFAGKASMPAPPCYFAWGCFRYFRLGARTASALRLFPGDGRPAWQPPRSFQSVFAFASLKLRRTPRFALRAPRGCATRSPKGEAWWARQDSNLQPDRYERRNLPGSSSKISVSDQDRARSCSFVHGVSGG